MPESLMHFEPFNKASLPRRLRDVDDFFKGFELAPGFRDFNAEPKIKIDVSETEQAYQVKAEIPGLNKEDIKVDIDGNKVSITAKAKRKTSEKEGETEGEAGGETVLRSERYYRQDCRSFTLASDIDESNAVAKYEDGILELTLPKKPAKSAKQITVT